MAIAIVAEIEKMVPLQNIKNTSESAAELLNFLETWDQAYKAEVETVPMFNPSLTKAWSLSQKRFFVRAFYHARGHYHTFLWYLGNFAPNVGYKKIILGNIQEEFGGKGKSHEHLYFDLAEVLGVDLKEEMLSRKSYLDFIKQFNEKHLEWLTQHDWISCFAAFSAYERLDNIDYNMLLGLAKSIDVSKKGLAFFAVHAGAKHFYPTLQPLTEEWIMNKSKIKNAFSFIAQNQLKMWKSLSRAIYEYV